MKLSTLFMAMLLTSIVSAHAAEDTSVENDSTEFVLDQAFLAELAYWDSIEATMNYQTGTVELGNGLATLEIPEGFRYLPPTDAEYVLTELWGNPPAESLGLLFPENAGIMWTDPYVIDITFEEMGYIDDSDAEDIDYDELLEEMQQDTQDSNPERERLGYEKMILNGWASDPYYDFSEKKLHWALDLTFGEDTVHTLNYNIRVLGRRGVLQMNFISGMESMDLIRTDIPSILPHVIFNDGHRYDEFDPDLDTVAAVGIGGLIAGKVLAKGGVLVALAKFWKFIAIGAVAALGALRKFFGMKKKDKGVMIEE